MFEVDVEGETVVGAVGGGQGGVSWVERIVAVDGLVVDVRCLEAMLLLRVRELSAKMLVVVVVVVVVVVDVAVLV